MNINYSSWRILLDSPELRVREGSEGLSSSDDGVMNESADGDHSQTTVLDFLELQIIDLSLGLSLELTSSVYRIGEGSRFTVGALEHVYHRELSIMIEGLQGSDSSEDLEDWTSSDVEESVNRIGNIVETIRTRKMDSISLESRQLLS